MRSGASSVAVAGLTALAGAIPAFAVVAGLEFGADGTITGVRIGISVTLTVQACAWLILTAAAWTQVRSLYPGDRIARDRHPAPVP